METFRYHGHHRDKELRCILVVGVDHDNDVRRRLQGEPVACLLIAAVAEIALVAVVHDSRCATFTRIRSEGLRHFPSGIARAVVDYHDRVCDALSKYLVIRCAQRSLGIVRWHYNSDFPISVH